MCVTVSLFKVNSSRYLVGQLSAVPDSNLFCQTTLLEPPEMTSPLCRYSDLIEMNEEAELFGLNAASQVNWVEFH